MPSWITIDSYQVELDLTGGDTTFRSVSTIEFACSQPGAATFLNLAAPRIHAITLNGEPVSTDAFSGERVTVTNLAERNVLVVDAECAYSRSGEGLHRFTDPADGKVYMYSDLETFDAHRIYACFDQPDMKASYELTVLAPRDWYVVSNMAPVAEAANHRRRGPVSRRRQHLAVPAHPGDVHLHHARIGRTVARSAVRARRHSARHLLPPVARQVPGP